MSGRPDPEDELHAAELAFGLLDAPDRAAADARRGHDADFDSLCEIWRSHATAFFTDGDVSPNAAVWAAIERRLPANDAAEAVALRHSVRRWRATSAMLALLTLVVGAFALYRPTAAPVQPQVIAAAAPTIVLLTGAPDVGVMAVSYDRSAGRIAATSSGLAIGLHAAELWVIPADQKPRSLGVIRANVADARVAPTGVRALIVPGAALAISVEPAGGSATGQPTGPVILTGKVTAS